MKKAISSFIMAIAVLLGTIANISGIKTVYAERVPTIDENVAEAYLGERVAENGFTKIGMGLTDEPSPSERLGEECWLLDTQRSWQGCYMNFTLDEYMKPEKFDGSEYTIEVDYFDAGKGGFFRICYRDREGAFKTAALVYTYGELGWKTVKVRVSDAVFDGTCYDHNFGNAWKNGMCDFLIQTRAPSSNTFSRETIAIKRVKVTRERDAYPVYLTAKNDEVGGMFKWYAEDKIIHNTFENLTDKAQSVKVKYIARDSDNYNRFVKEETISLAPNETKTVDLNFGELNRCDIYKYYADITLSDGRHYKFMPFEFAVIKTDPDGIKNDQVYFSGHIDRLVESEDDPVAKEYFDALALSNSGGYRSEVQWQFIIDSNGAFIPEQSKYTIAARLCKKYGLGYIATLCAAPTNDLFTSWHHFPKTEAEMTAWCEYVAAAADYLKDYTHNYELWNEPNIPQFNKFADIYGGKEYAALAKASKEAILKVDPEANVGGPCVTGIGINPEDQNTKAPTYFKDAVEAGMHNYIDSINLHPYANSMEAYEKSGRIEDIKWYKSLYEENGVNDPEIWHTECGFPQWEMTDEQRGVRNARMLLLFKSHDIGDKCSIYNFDKKGILDELDREDVFGHVTSSVEATQKWGKSFFPTKSYLITAGYNYVMADSEAAGIYDPEGQTNVRMARYKSNKFNSDILALWTVEDDENVTIDLGVNELKVYDAYGNESELKSDDGVYSFVARESLIYLVGSFPKLEYKSENKFEWEACNFITTKDDILTAKFKTQYAEKGYRISAELPDGAELVEEGGFDAEGNGELTIKNSFPAGESFSATVYVMDSAGNKIHSAPVQIESREPINVTMRLELPDASKINDWVATAKIRNISTNNVVKGSLKLKAPSEVSKGSAVDIGIIPRGTTGEVSIGLPKIVKKGKLMFEYDVITDSGEVYSFKEPLEITVAPYAHTKPEIDGVLDKNEWVYDAAMYADQGIQVKNIVGWGGSEDLSGRSVVMWDEDNFYIFFDVTDDIFNCDVPMTKHWDGDSIQLGITYGEEGFVAIGATSQTFHELGFADARDDTGAYRTNSTDRLIPSGKVENADIAIRRDGTHTIYEAKIPWDTLLFEGQRPKEGEQLGFSFLINDNDGTGRRGWIEYAGGIGSSKDYTQFTKLTLIK